MKIFKWLFIVVLCLSLLASIIFAWPLLPIISGFGAKHLCSCVFVALRDEKSSIGQELSSFPLNLGTFKIDLRDSSATGSVFFLAGRKAIFRKQFGCTLINDASEKQVRTQSFSVRRNFSKRVFNWKMSAVDVDTNVQHAGSRISKLVNSAFIESARTDGRNLRSILVIHNNIILAEQYANGFDSSSVFPGWSMCKSLFNNAVIGVLVRKGQIKLDSASLFKEWISDKRSTITLNNLMHMDSGLKWGESYEGNSDVTTMLYKIGDMGKYAVRSKLSDSIGSVFQYSSGTANAISKFVRNIIPDSSYHNFPYHEIYDKLGMNSLIIEPDASGTYVSSTFAWATARDWALFGKLYLDNGQWAGESIFPNWWLSYTTTPTKAAGWREYGAQFWLNRGYPSDSSKRYFAQAPTDMFWADGYQGQRLFIIPSKKLIVVCLAQSTTNYLDMDKLLGSIVESLPSTKYHIHDQK